MRLFYVLLYLVFNLNMSKLHCTVFLLTSLFFLLSCSNDDEAWENSVTEESFPLYMAVTNSMDKDLIFASEDYSNEYYGETFYFDKWNTYWGENLLQPSYQEDRNAVMPVFYDNEMKRYFIRLAPDNKLSRQMRACSNKQVLEYRFTSFSLFGDTEEHNIRLELQRITDKNTGQPSFVEFSVSVDGVKQNVYFPESWEGLYPKDSHGNAYRPYFVLNVNDL